MHKFRKHRGQEPPRKLCEVCDLTCLTTGGLRFHKNAEPSRMEGTQEFKCYLCDYTASKITASHLCFEQAQPKMYHSPKVDNGVDVFFFLNFLKTYFRTFFSKNLKLTSHLTVRAFRLIPTLRTRPECQLSADIHSHKAGTKLPYESALYLVWPRFFFKSTIFGYAQPWWATLNHS